MQSLFLLQALFVNYALILLDTSNMACYVYTIFQQNFEEINNIFLNIRNNVKILILKKGRVILGKNVKGHKMFKTKGPMVHVESSPHLMPPWEPNTTWRLHCLRKEYFA